MRLLKTFMFLVVWVMCAMAAAAQTKNITLAGTVIDSEDGSPLIGVAVLVQGTPYGTVTDVDGKYEITFPSKECTVVFSYIGYDDVVKEYRIRNASSFSNIVMKMNATQLADVVVTGVYERKKESFTGASATFKTDQLKSVGSANVLQSLRTLDPSFKMMESTQFGSNPNMMPDIEIRGKTSVVGLKEEYGTDPNQPLFILDGF